MLVPFSPDRQAKAVPFTQLRLYEFHDSAASLSKLPQCQPVLLLLWLLRESILLQQISLTRRRCTGQLSMPGAAALRTSAGARASQSMVCRFM